MKKLVSMLIVLALMATMAGCSKTPESAKTTQNAPKPVNAKMLEIENVLMQQLQPMPKLNNGEKVGALVITLANPFWVGMKNSYEAAAKELGIQVEVLAAPTEGDTKSQLETLEAMIAKDYKSLVVSPIEPLNLIPGIVKANQKGVKVVNLGPGVNVEQLAKNGGKIDGRITVSYEDQGKEAAKYIVGKLGSAGGKVAIIQGIPGAGQSEGRTKGARSVFESSPGVQVVSVQAGNWDRNTAYNIATNLIQAHPDLKAIFACNDVMALAAGQALEAAGKRQGVTIFGVDFIPEAKEAIKAGKLDGTIGYSAKIYGKAALILALKLAQNQPVPDVVNCPLVIVSKENVAEFENWE